MRWNQRVSKCTLRNMRAQGPIGVMLQLRHEFDIAEVDEITIELPWAGWHEIGGGQGDKKEKWAPTSRESADHSLSYLIARAIVDGDITLDSFSKEKIAEPRLRPVMQKIRVVDSPAMTKEHAGELPKWPSVTDVSLKGGKRIRRHSGIPKGHPLSPLDDSELKAKFMRLGRRVSSEANVFQLFDTTMNLEQVDDINELTRQFRFNMA